MSKHQIIYTSCRRGIDGVNDGQQVFSYDADFHESKREDIKGMFSYQAPSLQPGVIMSEELVPTMPKSFKYRVLNDGKCAIALSTYLGRDYMGAAGRFGNFLSHCLIADFEDFDKYPCEIFGSSELKSSIEYDLVNSPDTPDYLPAPELKEGGEISVDEVISFLEEDDNLEHFKRMVIALLKYKESKKRIIINDYPRNIVFWIAALEYAFPLSAAKKISFNTYEFDPELSSYQICGVLNEGSKYEVNRYNQSDRHFLFDFINNVFTDLESDEMLIDFIDVSFSFSFDNLLEFHNFIETKTSFSDTTEEFYDAYLLYSLLLDGINEISEEQFGRLFEFAKKYSDVNAVVFKLIDEFETVANFDSHYFLTVLKILFEHKNILSDENITRIRGIVAEKIMRTLGESTVEENTFINFYDSVNAIAKSAGISVPKELMNDAHRTVLMGILNKRTNSWSVYFVIKVVCQYVMDMKFSADDLQPGTSFGNFYSSVFNMLYVPNDDKTEVATKILTYFKPNVYYFINIAFNMDGYLRDLNVGNKDINTNLWIPFSKIASGYDDEAIYKINKELATYDRFFEMATLFAYRFLTDSVFEYKYRIFHDNVRWLREYPRYAEEQAQNIIDLYAKNMAKMMIGTDETFKNKHRKEIFSISEEFGVIGNYYLEFANEMALEELKKLNKISITYSEVRARVEYLAGKNIKIVGDLMLLYIGMSLGATRSAEQVTKMCSELAVLSGEQKSVVDHLDSKVKEKYFEWILDSLQKYSVNETDFNAIFSAMQISKQTHDDIIENYCKSYFKASKKGDYRGFAHFLMYVFEYGTEDDIETCGSVINGLNSQKLDELEENIYPYFKNSVKASRSWYTLKDIANNSNKISNFFKKLL